MVRSKKRRRAGSRERRFSVRGVRRVPPNVEKFSKALLALVVADNERRAQADHTTGVHQEASAQEQGASVDGGAPHA